MITNLTPYPAMTDSSVPWLGEVPERWDILPLCAVGTVKSIRGVAQRELLSVYLDRGVVRFSDVAEKRTNVTSTDLSRYQAVDPGDFVLNNQQAWRGSVGVSTLSGIVSPAYLVLSLSPKLQAGFAGHLLRSQVMVTQYLACSRGVGSIQRNLYWPHLKRVVFPSPPTSEQSAIALYLDHADRRIRRYIRAKERLIELLEEQKQAIIHQAVTGQIDVRTGQPYPAYKDCGVAWLGRVPEHWRVIPLKRWVSTKITDGPHETPEFFQVGVPFLSAEAVSDGRLDFGRRRGLISREQHDIYCRKCCPMRNDIFMCKSGATTGKVAIVETDDEFSVWSPLALIRVDPRKVLARLLVEVLRTRYLQRQIHETWSYGTQPNLSMGAMERLVVTLPPLDEQKAILDSLDPCLEGASQAVCHARREIELLHEYRTRLIADVVTGKLDIREAAAAMPEDLDAPTDAMETIDLENVDERRKGVAL